MRDRLESISQWLRLNRSHRYITCGMLLGLLVASSVQPAYAELGVTAPEQFSLPDGFAVELVYEVPGKEQGSWVSLTLDPQGRLVACDQSGSLYRVDLSASTAKVERLNADIGFAQGLLFAFDSLYVNVNGQTRGAKSRKNGVYRLQDTNGDDQFDSVKYILPIDGNGEHGPHALILSQDGKRIITCAGNHSFLPANVVRSRLPQNWSEDHLLGRMPDARGHAATKMAPGGWIGSFAPDGSDFELIAAGFRNEYDIALNDRGELFAYDADMEWDVGTPWYRPTRVNHVISGAEFGWRNGTGKWPAYYPDSFGAAVDVGPGSPTGICFGYGTHFPTRYRNALFIADWSYGNIHAVTLTADGSSYSGDFETFATAAPLPVTDMVVRPQDGALYFAIGGRGTQSGLYRITYNGKAAATDGDTAQQDTASQQLVHTRHELEAFHVGGANVAAIAAAMAGLSSPDRAVRYAARVALEHQPVASWREKITGLDNDLAKALAVIALARTGTAADKPLAIKTLAGLQWESLDSATRIAMLRGYGLIAMRMGTLDEAQADVVKQQIRGAFPSGDDNVDRELAQMLVYLKVPGATKAIVKEMSEAPSQENQLHYALVLRAATEGWNEAIYRDYFQWFNDVASARGGMSFGGFIANIKQEALTHVSDDMKVSLAEVLKAPETKNVEEEAREFVKAWTLDELLPTVEQSKQVPNFAQGERVFASAQCYKCHRMGIQGGILGPDLTAAGGRFSVKDLLTAVVEPSKVISDQYGATQFLTEDGKIVVGRVVNMAGKQLKIMTNMLDPSSQTSVNRDEIESTRPSKTSLMPAGLLDTFSAEEISDLVAYLQAGGKESHPLYRKAVAGK